MWIYGIRLFLIDSIKEIKSSAFNPDIIQTFLNNCNGKENQGAEMAIKLLGYYNKQEIVNKEPFCQKKSEFFGSNSEYSECKDGIERRNGEKDCLNCEDNYEKSNSIECKSEIERRDSENECSNCKDYKKQDESIVTCMNSEMESIKEAKPGAFNYKNFIQTFLSNSNGNVNQEAEMALKMLEYNKQKIVHNDELNQGNLKILASTLANSEYIGYKNMNGKGNSEKECSNHRGKHEKSNSFESKNLRQASKKDYPNCSEDKKFDIDIKTYIDSKFYDMENKLMQRIEEMEVSTNKKLNTILERLETLKLM